MLKHYRSDKTKNSFIIELNFAKGYIVCYWAPNGYMGNKRLGTPPPPPPLIYSVVSC